ncbi:MAG TPA: hypothetical protein VLA29_11655 [Acidimicrobiia bacterium]|nr:hypothetical protein [Acidimicrobiia bacterium]
MTAVYAVTLVVGLLGLGAWIVATAVADMVEGWQAVDPESRLGPWARRGISALIGFGMTGISTTYGGWPDVASFGAAIVGAASLAAISEWLGPRTAA